MAPTKWRVTTRLRTKKEKINGSLMMNQLGHHTEALKVLKHLEKQHPNDADVLQNIGRTYICMKEDEKGIPYLERAIDLNPKQFSAYGELGHAYNAVNRFQDGIDLLRPLLDNPENDRKDGCYYAIGRCYIGLDQYEIGIQHLQEVRKHLTQPGMFSDIDYFIALAYTLLGDNEAAEAAFHKALDCLPDSLHVHRAIAIFYIRMERMEEAEKHIAEALSLDPSRDATYDVLQLFEETKERMEKETQESATENDEEPTDNTDDSAAETPDETGENDE